MTVEVTELGLSTHEAADPQNTIPKWPTPGKAIERLRKDFPTSPDFDFLEYVNSWLYRTLSADSHLSLRGLIDRGKYFTPKAVEDKFGPEYKEVLKDHLEDYRTRMLWTAITLITAIASEIQAHFKFDRREALLHLWQLFEGASEISEEFYQFRYRDLLAE